MTTLQKTLVTATVAVLAGAGIYEVRQAAKLSDQVQAFQQQQAPLTEQVRQLQRERDDATNQLAGLLAENAQLKSKSNETELLRLRGEVTTLRAQLAEAKKTQGPIANSSTPAGQPNDLQILEADFGTDSTNMDVTAELNGRIRRGSLTCVASTTLFGDPDFGHVKSLTVVYRYGGVIQTNQFQEGDAVILPPEAP